MTQIRRAYIRVGLAAKGGGELEADEARHVVNVLRARPGDRLELLDGVGGRYIGEVGAVTKRTCAVKVLERLPNEPPETVELSVGVSMPDKKRASAMCRMLAELGVHQLFHLQSERSEWDIPSAKKLNRRLAKIARESCKQSGRAFPMTIGEPRTIEALCAEIGFRPGAYAVIASTKEGSATIGDRARARRSKANGGDNRVLAIIGPVGDFTDAEYELAVSSGFLPVTLGRHILRVETAAVALAAQVKG